MSVFSQCLNLGSSHAEGLRTLQGTQQLFRILSPQGIQKKEKKYIYTYLRMVDGLTEPLPSSQTEWSGRPSTDGRSESRSHLLVSPIRREDSAWNRRPPGSEFDRRNGRGL